MELHGAGKMERNIVSNNFCYCASNTSFLVIVNLGSNLDFSTIVFSNNQNWCDYGSPDSLGDRSN